MIETINVQESSFTYDPALQEISVNTEVRFVYRFGSFKLDADQFGEERLVSIEQIRKKENGLAFSIKSEKERLHHFKLYGPTAIDNLLFNLIAHFNKTIETTTEDFDRIELIFKSGNLSALYIYKNIFIHNEYRLLDSLRVVNENDELFMIKQKPFRKIKILQMNISNKIVVCQGENSEHYSFRLNVNDVVLEIVSDIIALV